MAGWLILIRVLPDAEAPSPAGTSFAGSLVLGVGDERGTRLYVVQSDGTGYRDGGEDGTELRIDGADVAISEGSGFYRSWLQWPAGNTEIPPAPEPSPVTKSAGVARVTCAQIENTARAGLDVFPELWDEGLMGVELTGTGAEVVMEVPPGKALVACVPEGGGPRLDSVDELRAAVPVQIEDPDARAGGRARSY